MRQTEKYKKAGRVLTFPHTSQDQLYQELNRLGWWWNSKKQEWERDETLGASEPSKLIKIRIWTDSTKVQQIADLFIESLESLGFKIQEKSDPYVCRPPQQNDSRIYLTFLNEERIE